MSDYEDRLKERRKEYATVHKNKVALLSDAGKMDKYISGITQQLSPRMKMAPKSKADLLVDRVDRNIDDSSSMKGFGPKLRRAFSTEIAKPENAGYSVNAIATGITKSMLEHKDEKGKSRLDRAYEDYRVEESSVGFLGFGGRDKGAKAPSSLPGMKTYTEWKAEKRAAEDAEVGGGYSLEEHIKNTNLAVQIGAGIGATGAFIAGQMGPQIMTPEEIVTVPTAAIISGVVAGGAEAVAYPWRKFVEKTEWGRAREAKGGFINKAKVLTAKYGPDFAVAGVAEAKLLSSVVVRGTAMTKAIAYPNAENVTVASKADDVVKKVAKADAKLPLGKRKQKGVAYVKARVKKENIDIDSDEATTLGKHYGALTADAKVAADAHPDGFLKGIDVEYEKHKALNFSTGKETADKVVKNVKAKETIVTKKATKAKAEKVVEKADATVVNEGQASIMFKSQYLEGDPAVNFVLRNQEKTIVKSEAGNDMLTLVGRNDQEEKLALIAHNPKDLTPAAVVDDVVETASAKKAVDFPSNFAQTDHAYLPATAKGLEDILEKGIAGGKYSADVEGALKTRKGKNIISVKKDALTLDKRGHITVDSKSKINPEDIRIRTESEERGIRWLSPEDFKKERELGKQYDEIGTYYDDLILKYNPKLKRPKYSDRPTEADIAAEEAFTKASIGIEKKLSIAEKNKLNTMLSKYDEVERTVLKMKSEIPHTTVEETKSVMMSIIKGQKSGDLTMDEAIKQTQEIALRVEQTPKDIMMGVDKHEMLGGISNYLSSLTKKGSMAKYMLAFGVGGATLESLNAENAEAANWAGIGKAAVKSAMEAFGERTIKGIQKKQLAVGKVMADDVMHVPEKGFQTGLTETAHGGAKYFTKNLNKIYRDGGNRLGFGTMSPQMQFNEVLKAAKGVMLNPAVFKATFFNAEAVNVKNGLRVMSNIFKDGDIVTARKELGDMFQDILPKAKNQYLHDYHRGTGDTLAKKIEKMKNADPDTKKAMRKEMHAHFGIAKSLEDKVREYHKAYQATAAKAAQKYSSARVFYAADDSTKFAKYPFMKNMKLTEQEVLAVGRLKRQMATYRVRLEKNGTATKDGAFMHYNLHPNMDMGFLDDAAGGSVPFMKNFTRSANSRPLLPDAVRSMERYIPDTERRIQTQAFWKSGWKEAMRRSAHIEPLQQAFRQLEQGVKPFENNWSNNAARWYANIEVFKRLFLSPSAGLKHLVKLTGDMSTLGIGTTLKSLPGSVKGVSYRIIENTPFMKKIAGNLYDPSQYTKMKKQLLDSVAPAMDTRYRMMQMGFGNYDTHFTKLGVMADQLNHAGGVFINLAELVDRGVTMEAGLRMAAKQGLTPEQATYGIYDTILKNNFLGREFTPRWLRDPKFKLLTMFQTTPYKIAEKRLVQGIRANRAVTKLGKTIFQQSKTPEGRQRLLTDLKNIRKDMTQSQQELKTNLFLDALQSEKDFYGNAVVKQFTKDLMIIGAGTAVAGSAGVNMSHHFFHLPFLVSSEYDDLGTLNISPAIKSISRGTTSYKKKLAEDEDAMMFTEILQKWMGKSGPFPDTMWKYNRISKDDIPDIYDDSAFKYLFGLPSKEKD